MLTWRQHVAWFRDRLTDSFPRLTNNPVSLFRLLSILGQSGRSESHVNGPGLVLPRGRQVIVCFEPIDNIECAAVPAFDDCSTVKDVGYDWIPCPGFVRLSQLFRCYAELKWAWVCDLRWSSYIATYCPAWVRCPVELLNSRRSDSPSDTIFFNSPMFIQKHATAAAKFLIFLAEMEIAYFKVLIQVVWLKR